MDPRRPRHPQSLQNNNNNNRDPRYSNRPPTGQPGAYPPHPPVRPAHGAYLPAGDPPPGHAIPSGYTPYPMNVAAPPLQPRPMPPYVGRYLPTGGSYASGPPQGHFAPPLQFGSHYDRYDAAPSVSPYQPSYEREYPPQPSTGYYQVPQAPLRPDDTEAADEEDKEEETAPDNAAFLLNTAASTFQPGKRQHRDFLRKHMEAEGRLGPGKDRKKPDMYKRGPEAERMRHDKKMQEMFKKPEGKRRRRKDEDDDLWE